MRLTRFVVWAGVAALASAGCSSSGGDDAKVSKPGELAASVASYDLTVGKGRRLQVGISDGAGQIVSYGSVRMAPIFIGTSKQTEAEAFVREAPWVPIPGQDLPEKPPAAPTLTDGGDGVGVYRLDGVEFDRPGTWGVVVGVDVGGRSQRLQATFEVVEPGDVVAVGEPAPRTRQPLAGAAPAKSVDSRARDDGTPFPDPLLHDVTIADALAAHRPVVVVVSTPVYCVSRFCGPVTDSAAKLAAKTGPSVAFVHLEVWNDFEGRKLNGAALEWIDRRPGGDANEPWVFVVDRDGTVVERFDNVTSDADLAAAVARITT